MESASPPSNAFKSRKYARAISRLQTHNSNQQRQDLVNIVQRLQQQSDSLSSEADFSQHSIDEGTVYCRDHLPSAMDKNHIRSVSAIFFGTENRPNNQRTFKSIDKSVPIRSPRLKENLKNSRFPRLMSDQGFATQRNK